MAMHLVRRNHDRDVTAELIVLHYRCASRPAGIYIPQDKAGMKIEFGKK